MRKSAASSLLAIVALALVLRLSPLTRFVYFGSDVGEYFRISHGLATTGHVALPYPGWGVTYPYFPGMFFLVAGTSFGGLEIGGSLSIVVPVLAGAALAFWLGYATTFRTSILTDVDIRPWWLPLAGFPVLVGILVGAVILRRRFSWRYRPRYPSLRHVVAGYGVALGFIYAL